MLQIRNSSTNSSTRPNKVSYPRYYRTVYTVHCTLYYILLVHRELCLQQLLSLPVVLRKQIETYFDDDIASESLSGVSMLESCCRGTYYPTSKLLKAIYNSLLVSLTFPPPPALQTKTAPSLYQLELLPHSTYSNLVPALQTKTSPPLNCNMNQNLSSFCRCKTLSSPATTLHITICHVCVS